MTAFPEPNPEFEAWRDTLPATHWARYDLSACRLGWEAAIAVKTKKDIAALQKMSERFRSQAKELLSTGNRLDKARADTLLAICKGIEDGAAEDRAAQQPLSVEDFEHRHDASERMGFDRRVYQDAQAEKDAARYRYIRDTPYIPAMFVGIKGYALKRGNDLDNAIDAAMGKEEKWATSTNRQVD
jgi:hypothetical protein